MQISFCASKYTNNAVFTQVPSYVQETSLCNGHHWDSQPAQIVNKENFGLISDISEASLASLSPLDALPLNIRSLDSPWTGEVCMDDGKLQNSSDHRFVGGNSSLLYSSAIRPSESNFICCEQHVKREKTTRQKLSRGTAFDIRSSCPERVFASFP